VRRAFEEQDEEAMTLSLDRHTNERYAALPEHEWILDFDATVKTLYAGQEKARFGCNPMKPGRTSPVYPRMGFSAGRQCASAPRNWC
jgi:hypothetical protein